MNIVELIKSQLTPDALGKLSSLVGEGEEGTKAAVGAAVPGLLALLAQLASSGAGADRLINSLRQVQEETRGTEGGFGDILAGPRAPEVQQKGGGLINILLGSAALPILLKLLSGFAKVSPETVKKLLGYLAPLILSMIAKQFSGRPLTAESLSGFFAEQKGNISGAMPPGLSLAGIPGLGDAPAAAAPEGGLPSWLIPLVGLGLLGGLAWWFLGQNAEPVAQNPPEVAAKPGPSPVAKVLDDAKKKTEAAKVEAALPDPAKLGTDLTGIYTSITELLGGIKDAATAESTAKKLSDVTPRVDGIKAAWDKLPESARAAVAKVTAEHLAKLRELVAKVLALPGVGEKLKPILDGLVGKLAELKVG